MTTITIASADDWMSIGTNGNFEPSIGWGLNIYQAVSGITHIELGNDIDLSQWYLDNNNTTTKTPVINIANNNFNGNNHTIYISENMVANAQIQGDLLCTGLFIINDGTIENVDIIVNGNETKDYYDCYSKSILINGVQQYVYCNFNNINISGVKMLTEGSGVITPWYGGRSFNKVIVNAFLSNNDQAGFAGDRLIQPTTFVNCAFNGVVGSYEGVYGYSYSFNNVIFRKCVSSAILHPNSLFAAYNRESSNGTYEDCMFVISGDSTSQCYGFSESGDTERNIFTRIYGIVTGARFLGLININGASPSPSGYSSSGANSSVLELNGDSYLYTDNINSFVLRDGNNSYPLTIEGPGQLFVYNLGNLDIDNDTSEFNNQIIELTQSSAASIVQNDSTNWQTSSVVGSFPQSLPILKALTIDLYTNNEYIEPTLMNYVISGDDPHVTPMYGNPYMLPHIENTFLLLDTNDSDRLVIKGKTWHVPFSNSMEFLSKLLNEKNLQYHKEIIRRVTETTYYKYIKFEFRGEVLIVDMETLKFVRFTNVNDLNNNCLPEDNNIKENFIVSDVVNSSETVIFNRLGYESDEIKKRELRVGRYVITLVCNHGEIKGNNGIRIKFPVKSKTYKGLLIRESDSIIVDF